MVALALRRANTLEVPIGVLQANWWPLWLVRLPCHSQDVAVARAPRDFDRVGGVVVEELCHLVVKFGFVTVQLAWAVATTTTTTTTTTTDLW